MSPTPIPGWLKNRRPPLRFTGGPFVGPFLPVNLHDHLLFVDVGQLNAGLIKLLFLLAFFLVNLYSKEPLKKCDEITAANTLKES